MEVDAKYCKHCQKDHPLTKEWWQRLDGTGSPRCKVQRSIKGRQKRLKRKNNPINKYCQYCETNHLLTKEWWVNWKDKPVCRIFYNQNKALEKIRRDAVTQKVCKKCGKLTDLVEFTPQKHGLYGRTAICRACANPPKPIVYTVVIHKNCTKCKEIKVLDQFYKNPFTKTGRDTFCKKCRQAHDRYLWANNLSYRKHKVESKRKTERKKLEEDQVYAFKHRIKSTIRAAFSRLKFKKGDRTEKILGCTFDYFREYLEKQFTHDMNWSNRGKKKGWVVDHIIPMALAKTKEDALKLNHYTNLRPLSRLDNEIKGDKILIELFTPNLLRLYNDIIKSQDQVI